MFREGDNLRGDQRLLKKRLTAVLNTEHEVRYRRVSNKLWVGRSISTRIDETENAGKSGGKELPIGHD